MSARTRSIPGIKTTAGTATISRKHHGFRGKSTKQKNSWERPRGAREWHPEVVQKNLRCFREIRVSSAKSSQYRRFVLASYAVTQPLRQDSSRKTSSITQGR